MSDSWIINAQIFIISSDHYSFTMPPHKRCETLLVLKRKIFIERFIDQRN